MANQIVHKFIPGKEYHLGLIDQTTCISNDLGVNVSKRNQ